MPSYIAFVIIRILVQAANQAAYLTYVCYSCEVVGPSGRKENWNIITSFMKSHKNSYYMPYNIWYNLYRINYTVWYHVSIYERQQGWYQTLLSLWDMYLIHFCHGFYQIGGTLPWLYQYSPFLLYYFGHSGQNLQDGFFQSDILKRVKKLSSYLLRIETKKYTFNEYIVMASAWVKSYDFFGFSRL